MTLLVSALFALTVGYSLALGCGLALLAVERGQPVRFDLRGVSAFVRELAAHLLFLALKAGGRLRPDPMRADHAPGSRVPVLLIPGYADSRTTMAPLAAFLRARGWGWVHVANNVPFSAPLPVLAAAVVREADRLKQACGAERVDIVGFSVGGVLATWAVNHLDYAKNVRTMVAIATPFSGTRLAVFGKRLQARDLLPDSECIQKLNTPQIPTTAIRSTFDPVILPASSAQLPEDDPQYTNHVVHWHGHHAMLLSTQVFSLVAEALGTND